MKPRKLHLIAKSKIVSRKRKILKKFSYVNIRWKCSIFWYNLNEYNFTT